MRDVHPSLQRRFRADFLSQGEDCPVILDCLHIEGLRVEGRLNPGSYFDELGSYDSVFDEMIDSYASIAPITLTPVTSLTPEAWAPSRENAMQAWIRARGVAMHASLLSVMQNAVQHVMQEMIASNHSLELQVQYLRDELESKSTTPKIGSSGEAIRAIVQLTSKTKDIFEVEPVVSHDWPEPSEEPYVVFWVTLPADRDFDIVRKQRDAWNAALLECFPDNPSTARLFIDYQ